MTTAPGGRTADELRSALALLVSFRAAAPLPADHPERQALAEAAGAVITDAWSGSIDGAVVPLLALCLDLVGRLAVVLGTDEGRVLQALGRQYAGAADAWTMGDPQP